MFTDYLLHQALNANTIPPLKAGYGRLIVRVHNGAPVWCDFSPGTELPDLQDLIDKVRGQGYLTIGTTDPKSTIWIAGGQIALLQLIQPASAGDLQSAEDAACEARNHPGSSCPEADRKGH